MSTPLPAAPASASQPPSYSCTLSAPPWGRRSRFDSGRTSACTRQPSASSLATSREPKYPVAPVTRQMRLVLILSVIAERGEPESEALDEVAEHLVDTLNMRLIEAMMTGKQDAAAHHLIGNRIAG